jgi:DNA-binding LytR/AlgR family response regulator
MNRRIFDLLAVAGIFAAYSITLRLANHSGLSESLLGGLANTMPVVIFGAIVRRLIVGKVVGRPAAFQLLAHLLLCVAFSVLSYGLLIVLLGLFHGEGPSGFLVQPFSVQGAAWQSLENVTTYALIATVSHLQAQSAAPAAGQAASAPQAERPKAATRVDDFVVVPTEPPPGDDPDARADVALSRYFVRIGDELRPIDVDTVVSIGGADDYAEVRTLTGKHLVRMTLAEFAKSLDPAQYVRVHRSSIVNVHRIARAEPAGGGRLLLHMETGHTISTSRTGAKLLRDRVI